MSRISVVMPTRNMADTIQDALKSVLIAPEVAEVIVVDDQSTDDTLARVQSVGDPRVRVLPGPPEGYPESMNTGFDAVISDYVVRCDADDYFLADRLGLQIDWLDSHPDYVAISSAYATTDERGRQVALLSADGEARDVTEILLHGQPVTHFCTFITRIEAIRQIGGLRSWFQTGSDLDLQYRIAGAGRVWHDPTIQGYLYRLHGASVTHRQIDMRRKFFDQTSHAFAHQRLVTGEDDLMRGNPPEIPQPRDKTEQAVFSVKAQIAGQLEGGAWRSLRAGQKVQALRNMWRAIWSDPMDLGRWPRLAKMVIKRSGPRL
jgi:glycosyltransferase involved in cell wall biosynthesis